MKISRILLGILVSLSLTACDDKETLNIDIRGENNAVSSHPENDVDDPEADIDDPEKDSDNPEKDSDDPEKDIDDPPKDPNQCNPACEEGFSCIQGTCLPLCTDDLTYCKGECLELASVHMKSCKTCEETYENCDGDIQNGCEVDVTSDVNNCGACGNECPEGNLCSDGVCVNACANGELACDGECVNKSKLHLKSCTKCADNYCDSDGNIRNGCDINFMGDDANNCGACGKKCGNDMICSAGTCKPKCASNETLCGDKCTDLGKLHKKSCDACASGYSDCDKNAANGCEVKLDSTSNCGACGKTCSIGESCVSGQCKNTYNAHTRMIVAGTTAVRAEPNAGATLANYPMFTYIWAIGEKSGWYMIEINGKTGWVQGEFTMAVCDNCPGRKAITEAEKYLYDKTHSCTYDLRGVIPYFNPSIGYDNNCANFVTAILQAVGLINYHTDQVQNVITYCSGGNENYHEVPFESSQAGDIWARRVPENGYTYSHTELTVGAYKNPGDGLYHVVTIGSTNFSSCAADAIRSGGYQRVIYTDRNLRDQPGAHIYSRQH